MEILKQTIFSSILVPIMTVLGVGGFNYIETQVDQVTVNYKTVEGTPTYYYLYVKNIGEKARFDISTETSWIFVYREGNNTQKSVTMAQGNAVNFILEFHSEFLNDGQHSGKVKISASNSSDSTLWETKEIDIVFNKNYTPPSPTPSPTQIFPTAATSPSANPTPTPTLLPSPTLSQVPTMTSVPKTATPRPSISKSISPTPAVILKPGQGSPSPQITPRVTPEEKPSSEGKGLFYYIKRFFSILWIF